MTIKPQKKRTKDIHKRFRGPNLAHALDVSKAGLL